MRDVRDISIYQMEIAGCSATLYLVRQITVASRAALLAACEALPTTVNVLCVSVQDPWQLAYDSVTPVAAQLRCGGADSSGGDAPGALRYGLILRTD